MGLKTITKKWWHIRSKIGDYLSRSRFGTEQAARQEMIDNDSSFPSDKYEPVEVTYTYQVPEAD